MQEYCCRFGFRTGEQNGVKQRRTSHSKEAVISTTTTTTTTVIAAAEVVMITKAMTTTQVSKRSPIAVDCLRDNHVITPMAMSSQMSMTTSAMTLSTKANRNTHRFTVKKNTRRRRLVTFAKADLLCLAFASSSCFFDAFIYLLPKTLCIARRGSPLHT